MRSFYKERKEMKIRKTLKEIVKKEGKAEDKQFQILDGIIIYQ